MTNGVDGKPPVSQGKDSSLSQNYGELAAKAAAAGSIGIIVRLNMPFVPEGQLSEREAGRQRARISQMQDQLCSALAGHRVTRIKKFTYAPYLAMMVDAEALRLLISSPLVLSIEEDKPVRPAK